MGRIYKNKAVFEQLALRDSKKKELHSIKDLQKLYHDND